MNDTTPTNLDKTLLTLVFNGPRHWCGWCGRDADPFELRHRTIPSRIYKYGGCNARWLYITSEMGEDGKRRALNCRPDLAWIDMQSVEDLSGMKLGEAGGRIAINANKKNKRRSMKTRSDISVRVIQQTGSDELVVRAARRSSANSDNVDGAPQLIRALMKGRHGSPFEHGMMTIEVECPIFVAREWMRHRIGWSYSELSGRYSELEGEFWVPPPDRGIINEGKAIRPHLVAGSASQDILVQQAYRESCTNAYSWYQMMLNAGIAKEVARGVLPVTTYTNFFATANPRSIMHFLSLRVQSEDSTYATYPMREIQDAAEQLEERFSYYWPHTHRAFVLHGRVAP